ncbi:MAG: hypothetical protein ORN57_01360 [Alphaproteobacteria bacterium]|nr:hypothetical protein [Alphaproteobacteria bacterium]
MKKFSMILALGFALTSLAFAAEGKVNDAEKAKCDSVMKMDKSTMKDDDVQMMKKCEKMMKM